MEYRVEELAGLAGVSVDTLRFYQGRGLLPPPDRRGRVAIYDDDHLERLKRIRELLAERFTLAQIRKLLENDSDDADGAAVRKADATRSLLEALVEESVGERTWSRSDLAAESGVPEPLLAAAQAAGLVEPLSIDGEERFSSADLEMFRAGLAILGAGFPMNELLQLAIEHAQRIQASTEAAIGLFDDSVMSGAADGAAEADAIADAFRTLLPQVTRLVALHFQRTLVNGALDRLRARGDREALERALAAATESGRLEVSWQR